MSAPAAHHDIDTAIARGEWWLRLFYALARQAERRLNHLTGPRGGPARGLFQAMDRAARCVRLALIAALHLEQILSALAALRLRSAADIAAARARALDRARTRVQEAGRWPSFDDDDDEDDEDEEDHEDDEDDEDDEDSEDWRERDAPDRETPDREPRDPLVDSLDRRLAAVDPLLVDFDALDLRETVNRICADLGVTPDWERWEAGDWSALEASATPEPAAPTPARAAAPASKTVKPPALAGLPPPAPRSAETTVVPRRRHEIDVERSRPRLE